jgi:hypothetical protein
MTVTGTTTRCRTLVAGFGRPGMRDMDAGRPLVRYLEGLGWPDGVVVEDLSYAATLVLHRLQELDPAKIVALVRAEVDGAGDRDLSLEADADVEAPSPPAGRGPSPALAELVEYADRQNEARALERGRAGRSFAAPTPLGSDLTVLGRRRPWNLHALSVANWFDVVALGDGWFFFVVGDVARRGRETASAVAELRTAVRAYAVAEGTSPGRVLDHLDRFVGVLGLAPATTVACAALQPTTRTLHLANAGHCPPLLLTPGGANDYLWHGRGGRVGHERRGRRQEESLGLPPGSTLLLCSDGLVRAGEHSIDDGLVRIQAAAAERRRASLDSLCDHVLRQHPAELHPGDHVSLLALRLS